MPEMALRDGDSVVVDELQPLSGQYYVSIVGVVNKPGVYPCAKGYAAGLDVVGAWAGRGAYLKEAEIARMPEDRSQGQLATTVRAPLDSTYLFERDSLGRYAGPPGLPPRQRRARSEAPAVRQHPDLEGAGLRPAAHGGDDRSGALPGVYPSVQRTSGSRTSSTEPAGSRPRRTLTGSVSCGPQRRRPDRHRSGSGAARARLTATTYLATRRFGVHPEFLASVKVNRRRDSRERAVEAGGGVGILQSTRAGGFSYLADKGRVSVRFANGEVRTKKGGPKPGPGSEVFVPVKDTTARTNYVALFGAIAQIVASTVAIIVVVTR